MEQWKIRNYARCTEHLLWAPCIRNTLYFVLYCWYGNNLPKYVEKVKPNAMGGIQLLSLCTLYGTRCIFRKNLRQYLASDVKFGSTWGVTLPIFGEVTLSFESSRPVWCQFNTKFRTVLVTDLPPAFVRNIPPLSLFAVAVTSGRMDVGLDRWVYGRTGCSFFLSPSCKMDFRFRILSAQIQSDHFWIQSNLLTAS